MKENYKKKRVRPWTKGTNPRAKKTNPRALGTNPRALKAWFENMWANVPSIKKRGKVLTWNEVKKLRPKEEEREQIMQYFSDYYKIKQGYDKAGVFFPEMQDPVRVIKNKRYLDVLEPYCGNGSVSNRNIPEPTEEEIAANEKWLEEFRERNRT